MSKNLSHLSFRKGLEDNLFEEIGQLGKDRQQTVAELKDIADEYLLGTANVFGTASFYDFTREANAGKRAYVCNGSACLVAGTQDQLKLKLGQHYRSDEIGEMCCLGRCHENSAFHINGHNYSGSDVEQITQIKGGEQIGSHEKYYVGHMGSSILTGPAPDPEELLLRLREMLGKGPSGLLEEIKMSGLRGRGGAGFPIGIKLEGCMKAEGDVKFIVCNADEGDPGSYSDRYLLEKQPLLVLLGMWISGYITGASRGVVYIRAEYPESVEAVRRAVEMLRQEKITGHNILGSQFNFEFKVIKAQGAYICGEETALLSSIEGQRPEVRVRPPFPVQEGLFRRPTVVNNVETLANLFYICTQGGDAYKAIGTVRSTGTKLMSLDSAFNRPGIYEVDMGTPLNEVIEQLGLGFRRRVKALHIGGPLGGLVPIQMAHSLSVDFESFSNQGFMLGHASVVSVPEEYPMIEYLEHLFEFTAHESCGKCFPCRLGSTRGKELIHKARTDSQFKIDTELLNDLLDTMKRGSLCALGGGIPLPVMNALQYFSGELSPYIKA